MFFNGSLFWFLNGIIFVLVAFGFKAFAKDQGWTLNWWKNLLAIVWYAIFGLNFFAWGTLIGEMEAGAGFKIFLLGLGILFVLGIGLWRLLAMKPKEA